jgi:hypothetical protein
MERADIVVTDFEFDAENAEHIGRHGVFEHHLREVLRVAPQFFVNPPTPERTASHLMLGPTTAGRFILAAIIQIDGDTWRPITAHWFHERLARRFYREDES